MKPELGMNGVSVAVLRDFVPLCLGSTACFNHFCFAFLCGKMVRQFQALFRRM